jgi:hemin uptake protein HemP
MGEKSQEASATGARAGSAAPRRLLSRDLLADAQEVIIDHQGESYRLRCTSKGKLILTK